MAPKRMLPPSPPRRTLWMMYKGIEPRYRILLGMGFMGFSMFGLWVSDRLEKAYPPEADTRVTHVSHRDTAAAESSQNRTGS
ncbi:hypothetical protein GGH12_004737 [Coemansia sp. RSA 1822]|nr:hypothetical protein LPJ76_004606 [Coemansia sp. RSA 638]KAJ2119779.1 hypothetical protein IW147_005594 [Coemansia sp. RSA 720]KAJ2538613.1 hypothetical protein GGF49_005804 [Coemansia sp. RSA 1853]KAJ2560526.1 hypothetical protein GGH12_004737 [Coemansia sp. RSA 1822]KAJ2656671.1 hypothetical protein IW148_005521 [Coemansia sp. RSA 1199]